MSVSRTPSATYRLQLTPDFSLYDAAGVVPYLAELGISHVYCSPWLQSAPGSTHGYDVVDHKRVNAELGGEDGLRALVDACRASELGLVLDIVPNHMSVPNDKLDDVRRRGTESPYARWFDIDWEASSGDRLVYRRFFDIDGLIGLRVEDPDVFAETHELVIEQARAGIVDGLRIDHPDGLADPEEYLHRLRSATGVTWTVVEKILEPGEELPTSWACEGTTGYDALNRVTGLFVDRLAEDELTAAYAELAHARVDWHAVAEESKRVALRTLAPELDRLTRVTARSLGLATADVRDALAELLVALPVYRAYVQPGRPVPDGARALVKQAERAAAKSRPDLDEVLALIRESVLTGPAEVVIRFQQTSGPLMAKGHEDTAYYRYNRLIALCEVGGDPGRFGTTTEEFHQFARRLAESWPRSMTSLSTHDTKRSEDVRARLAVLTEAPGEWSDAVARWSSFVPDGVDGNTAYLLWQSLVGAWPVSLDRMARFAEKAIREAKEHTAWVDGDPAYEKLVRELVERMTTDPTVTDAVSAFVSRLEPAARANSLGQKLVQLTMPGVPDLYQGSERPIHHLVDPDNRRPVDFAAAQASLRDGSDEKQRLVATVLRLRRGHPEWYGPEAAYEPVHADGAAADHAVAFLRGGGALTIVSRFTDRLMRNGGWRDTVLSLPPGSWTDVLGRGVYGGTVPLGDLLSTAPVALLVRSAS